MFQLYFLITLNCNLKCGHCIRKYNDRFFISSMSIDDCKKYIAYLKKAEQIELEEQKEMLERDINLLENNSSDTYRQMYEIGG